MPQELSREGVDLVRPIWESPYAELYLEAPGIRSYVIWEYVPGEEGVNQYDRFDNYDPLPHHLYSSKDEYDAAKRKYLNGGSPDKLIDVRTFPSWEKSIKKIESPVIIVFDADQITDGEIDHSIAA